MSTIKWVGIAMPEGYFIAELPWSVIRMPGGVGGCLSDEASYPDFLNFC